LQHETYIILTGGNGLYSTVDGQDPELKAKSEDNKHMFRIDVLV